MEIAAPFISRIRPVLVTGGAGFIGTNLVDRLARQGSTVLVFDALARDGVEENAEWLTRKHRTRVSIVNADVRDAAALEDAARRASVVFHLAAQVAVTSSISDPAEDFSVNLQGVLNLLEALRKGSRSPIIFASTNKVYGDLSDLALVKKDDCYKPLDPRVDSCGVDESRPLDFHTPYGCSKGAADQYVLDYARTYAIPAVVFRMSCIYGPHQMGNEDQGWVAHFMLRALADQTIAIYGDGRQVRDILYVEDAVDAYLGAWRRIEAVSGRAFNLGGGPANAVSLLQLIAAIEQLNARRIRTEFHDWRPGDQRYYVSNPALAQKALGLNRPLDWREGLRRLFDWLRSERAPNDARSHEAVS